MKLENDTVWLTQSQTAELFGKDQSVIARHIANAFKEDEVTEELVISDYVYALDTLDRYDYQSLGISQTTREEPFRATYENAMGAINALKGKFGGSQWLANEKDDSFKSSIGQIYQTFGGEDLYPSVEEKGNDATLPRGEEPLVQRWQQAYHRHALPVVHGEEQHTLRRGRAQAHRRQHPRGSHADDSREPYGREGRDGEGGGQFDK